MKMGLKQGMNDIYLSGVFNKDINVALFKYDVVYDEFSSEDPQLLATDYRTGKLVVNTLFKSKGRLKDDVEEILEEYAEEYYIRVVEDHKDSQQNIFIKLIKKIFN